MNRVSDFFWCTVFALVGVIIATTLTTKEVRADIPKGMPELPILKFNPTGQLDLLIDLENGEVTIQSNANLAKANVTVNHPATKPEIVYKYIKKEVNVETEKVLFKTVMFPLQVTKLDNTTPKDKPLYVEK